MVDSNSRQVTVSVIVPVYNDERWLPATLDCLRNQTFRDFEVILVDDGSTDRSGALCDDAQSSDKRFRTVHQPNGGLSRARNTGLDSARGEYVFFLDSDDLIHPRTLEILTRIARLNNADITIGGILRSAKDEGRFLERKVPELPSYTNYLPDVLIAKVLYQTERHDNSLCGRLFRRNLFNDIRLCPGSWFEDLDIFYKIYGRARLITVVDAQFYFYRVNPESFMQHWSNGRLDVLDVTDSLLEYYRGTPLELAAKDRLLSASFNILTQIYKHGVELPEAVDRCWNNIRSLRRKSLFNRRVRFKNKLGIAASYMGRPMIRLLSKFYNPI